ncbi:conserved hypothetical protein [Burkholderia vietnamiensis]|nr:conserved hypothetical protein [Burkholderia vietnamiensis]
MRNRAAAAMPAQRAARVVSFAHCRRIRYFPMNYADHYKSTK